MYDIAIIGAGINGASVAYELIKQKKSVIMFDMQGIATGGSGAAGAFISPKFSKAGELKELIDEAFTYSMAFYEKNFSHLFEISTLVHTSQDNTQSFSIESGKVDAHAMCYALCKGVKFVQVKVDSLVYDEGMWLVNDMYGVKEVVLATGAYEQVLKEPYIKLRGIWGHRIDITTSTSTPNTLHQFVSISQGKDGVMSIGATHDITYHPQTSTKSYDIQKGRKELLEKASQMIDLQNVEVIKDYTGLRSGSHDYMPLVGSLVISKETLASKDIVLKTKSPDYDEYDYYPNLYMINGSGGYGFVLAPYLAKMLVENILSEKKINKRLSPARFFYRWAKKL